MKKNIQKGFILLLFLIGLGVFLYPTISNWLASRNQIKVTQEYQNNINDMSPEQLDAEWAKAEDYNATMQAGKVTDPFSDVEHTEPFDRYDDTLNVHGVMGHIEIPKINQELPIYHGVTDEVLKKGVGHIKATGLPIGGEGNHPVLSGHSGLPQAKIFTDLNKLDEGDYFVLHVLNRELYYQVDQITVVEPDDVSRLQPVEGKDYVTLVTCTPIGINSQRLLVRGVRTDKPKEAALERPLPLRLYLGIGAIVLFVLILIIYLLIKRRKKDKESFYSDNRKRNEKRTPSLR